jgi:hypothetical protein
MWMRQSRQAEVRVVKGSRSPQNPHVGSQVLLRQLFVIYRAGIISRHLGAATLDHC